jgi:hypothetical protein
LPNRIERPVSRFVQPVEETKLPRLAPTGPLGEDNLGIPFDAAPLDQPRDISRIVLAVAVHDHENSGRLVLLEIRQPHCDCALMPEVTADS